MIDEYSNIIDFHLISIHEKYLVNNQIEGNFLLNYKIQHVIVVNLIEILNKLNSIDR